jgi:hypothetical protein
MWCGSRELFCKLLDRGWIIESIEVLSPQSQGGYRYGSAWFVSKEEYSGRVLDRSTTELGDNVQCGTTVAKEVIDDQDLGTSFYDATFDLVVNF